MGYKLIRRFDGAVYNRCLYYLDSTNPVLPPTSCGIGSVAENKSVPEVYYLATNRQWYKQVKEGEDVPTITGGAGYIYIGTTENTIEEAKIYYIDNGSDLSKVMSLYGVKAGSEVMQITNGRKWIKGTDDTWYIDLSGSTSGGGSGGHTWASDGAKILTGLFSTGTSDEQLVKFKLTGYNSTKGKISSTGQLQDALGTLEKSIITASSTAPESPELADIYYDTNLKRIMVYDGTNWIPSSAANTGVSLPSSAVPGQVFFNTASSILYVYDGTTWKAITSSSGSSLQSVSVVKSPSLEGDYQVCYITATDLGITDASQVINYPQITLIKDNQIFLPNTIDYSVKTSSTLCKIVCLSSFSGTMTVSIVFKTNA